MIGYINDLEYKFIISNEDIYFAYFNKSNNEVVIFELIMESVERHNNLFRITPLREPMTDFNDFFFYAKSIKQLLNTIVL